MAIENGIESYIPPFFLSIIEKYQTLIFIFVRAHREGNFALYVEVLDKLVPLFFAMDHPNYVKWTSVYVRDMQSLPEEINKTAKRFSSILIDRTHEQENKMVKGTGGILGLTEDPIALRRCWQVQT